MPYPFHPMALVGFALAVCLAPDTLMAEPAEVRPLQLEVPRWR
jgi:hypothetical protein